MKGVPVVTKLTVLLLAALLLAACTEGVNPGDRFERPLYNLAPVDSPRIVVGPQLPADGIGGPDELQAHNPYEGNSHAIRDGRLLYLAMNCNNCHGDGGGSIGPTLWDDSWIYGSSPSEIAESIIRGRPDGMPAYGNRIPEDQVWRIVAYLQYLEPAGGLQRAGDP